jgi:hypothetical protein
MFKKLCSLLVLASVLLTACNLSSAVPATEAVPSIVADALPPEVAIEIQNQLSKTLGVATDQIQIETVEQSDWSNSCLGLAEPDEVCAEVITPGWLVVFNIGGTEYRYRVNETGTNIRQEP